MDEKLGLNKRDARFTNGVIWGDKKITLYIPVAVEDDESRDDEGDGDQVRQDGVTQATHVNLSSSSDPGFCVLFF